MALIEIRQLVKEFEGRRVLGGIDLDLNEGELKLVMGPSGCGKTTLLRCLNRLVEPSSGTIRIRGVEVTGPDVDVRALRQSIGFVFQQFALYRHLTVLENVTLGLRRLRGMSRAEAEEKAMHELARLDMAAHRDKYPSQISGGQKQRVAIARALAMDPSVIVFDEPTSALDPLMSREVATIIKRLNAENVTMLCVTHDLQLARELPERVVYLDHGVITAEGNFDSLCRDHADLRVRAFFGSEAKR